MCWRGCGKTAYFNSHPRKGGDCQEEGLDEGTVTISIPTPVKGVTRGNFSDADVSMNFNSHPRKGGDPLLLSILL